MYLKFTSACLIAILTLAQHAECGLFIKQSTKKVLARYIKNCESDPDSRIIMSFNYKKYNRTADALDINFTMFEPYDSTYEFKFDIWKWGDGGWKKNFLAVRRKNACEFFHATLGNFVNDILIKMNCSTDCPIPVSSCSIKDYRFDYGAFDFPIFSWPGRFYLVIQSLKNEKVMTCTHAEINVEEMYT